MFTRFDTIHERDGQIDGWTTHDSCNRMFHYILPVTWTFRYHLRRFFTWKLRYLDGSRPGRFATWTFGTFGRFDTRTFRHRMTKKFYSIANYKLSDRRRNVQALKGGSEKSWYRNVQRCETFRWRIIRVANRPGI